MEKYINTRINGVDCTFYATNGNFYEMTLENNYLHVCMSYNCGHVGGVVKDVEGFCTESFNDENSFGEAVRLLKEWALISYETMCDIINAWRDFVASVVEEFHNFTPDIRVADVRGYGYKQDAPGEEKKENLRVEVSYNRARNTYNACVYDGIIPVMWGDYNLDTGERYLRHFDYGVLVSATLVDDELYVQGNWSLQEVRKALRGKMSI